MAEPQTKGEELHRIYFDAHTTRMREALERARIEFAEAGLAEGVYAQYVAQLLETQMTELSNVQKALLDYDEAAAKAETERGKSKEKKGKLSGEENAKLLAVAVDAGKVSADAVGDASKRQLEVSGIVNKAYEPTDSQSKVMNTVITDVNKTIALASATSTADFAKTITDSIAANITPGTFDPGSSQSKSSAAALMSATVSAMSSSALYNSSPANKADIDSRVRAGIASALGVTTNYTNSADVEADKANDVVALDKVARQQGGSVAARAGEMALALVRADAQPPPTAAETAAQAETKTLKEQASLFDKDFGDTYLKYLKQYGSPELAQERAINDYHLKQPGEKKFKEDPSGPPGTLLRNENGKPIIDITTEEYDLIKGYFDDAFQSKVDYLNNSPTLERKWYDPVYVDMYARSKKLSDELNKSGKQLGEALEDIKDVPTEEQKRRRGSEIYEPLAPGAARKGAEAATVEYAQRQKDGTMTKGEERGDVDDFLAERIVKREMPMDETKKIVMGAAVRAQRAGKMTDADRKDAMLGWRLYNNVATGQLKDTSTASIVRHAADLANGDVTKRDEILTSFYRWKLDKQVSVESAESNDRLAEVKAAEQADIAKRTKIDVPKVEDAPVEDAPVEDAPVEGEFIIEYDPELSDDPEANLKKRGSGRMEKK